MHLQWFTTRILPWYILCALLVACNVVFLCYNGASFVNVWLLMGFTTILTCLSVMSIGGVMLVHIHERHLTGRWCCVQFVETKRRLLPRDENERV